MPGRPWPLPALWSSGGRLVWLVVPGQALRWLVVWLLHACLLLTLLHHLRLFLQPVPAWLVWLHTPGRVAGHLLPLPLPLLLLLLLLRRLASPLLRRLSSWEDYFAPALLLLLSLSGLAMDSLARPSLVQIKVLALGLTHFSPAPPPASALFALHFLLALALLAYLPGASCCTGWGSGPAPA